MIPSMIDSYLREHNLRFEHFIHGRTIPAQRLAAAEHVSGSRVAKVVVLSVEGRLALAVIPAPARFNAPALAEVLGARKVEIVPESSFVDRFWPCEAGAEPPLSLFGVPIFVDAELARQPRVLMRGGTHEDAIVLDTDDWLLSEHARVVAGLGTAVQ